MKKINPERGKNDYLYFTHSSMQGYRKEMEDAHTIDKENMDIFNSSEYREKVKANQRVNSFSFLGVYDGHGGNETARYLEDNLLRFIVDSEKRRFGGSDLPPMRLFDCNESLENAFLSLDDRWREMVREMQRHVFNEPDQSGSTCNCVMVVPYTKSLLEIICCNVGDSRCVLYNTGKVIEMSRDHKPNDAREIARIRKAGGTVDKENRVTRRGEDEGILALSRAFGDFSFKTNSRLSSRDQIVTALPSIIRYDLNLKDTGFKNQYRFMILACDGVWDVITNDDCCEFVLERLKEQERGVYYRRRRKRMWKMYHDLEVGCLPALKPEVANRGEYDLESIAEELIDYCALEKQSKDNMSAIIVLFTGEWDWIEKEEET